MSDEVLEWCNETELIGLAHKQGLGRIRRGLSKETLIALVSGAIKVGPEHLAQSVRTRGVLEDFITLNRKKLESQLPGCNGRCRTFHCTDGKHALCYFQNRDLL